MAHCPVSVDSVVEVSDGGTNKLCVRSQNIAAFSLDSLERRVEVDVRLSDGMVPDDVTLMRVELSSDPEWEGCPLYTYEELVKNSRKPDEVQKTVEKHVRFVFSVKETGYYVVRLSSQQAITFKLD